jgi:hypothetical protein
MNAQSKDVIPLDIAFLNSALQNEDAIPSELGDIVVRRSKEILDEIKAEVKIPRSVLTADDLVYYLNQQQGVDEEAYAPLLQTIEGDFADFNTRIAQANGISEVNKVVVEI